VFYGLIVIVTLRTPSHLLRPNITDFGLAKELKGYHTNGYYKLTGNTGSRRYMAPEVAKVQHYNLSVDVYSFAILLHEIASLEKPFQGYTASKHMAQVVMGGERPRLDTASTSWFPCELQWLFRKCWSPIPTERPTFTSVKTSLEDIVETSPKSIGNTVMDGSDAPPDFSKIKPVAKPTRQVKSLGFLRKN
jgi:serine/threonine protein kinase